jgi:uncharacterized membrane protein
MQVCVVDPRSALRWVVRWTCVLCLVSGVERAIVCLTTRVSARALPLTRFFTFVALGMLSCGVLTIRASHNFVLETRKDALECGPWAN